MPRDVPLRNTERRSKLTLNTDGSDCPECGTHYPMPSCKCAVGHDVVWCRPRQVEYVRADAVVQALENAYAPRCPCTRPTSSPRSSRCQATTGSSMADQISREWRVAGIDRGDCQPDYTDWTTSPMGALANFETWDSAKPPFDEVWLETRTVTYTERERVAPGDLASMLETYRSDQLK